MTTVTHTYLDKLWVTLDLLSAGQHRNHRTLHYEPWRAASEAVYPLL